MTLDIGHSWASISMWPCSCMHVAYTTSFNQLWIHEMCIQLCFHHHIQAIDLIDRFKNINDHAYARWTFYRTNTVTARTCTMHLSWSGWSYQTNFCLRIAVFKVLCRTCTAQVWLAHKLLVKWQLAARLGKVDSLSLLTKYHKSGWSWFADNQLMAKFNLELLANQIENCNRVKFVLEDLACRGACTDTTSCMHLQIGLRHEVPLMRMHLQTFAWWCSQS